MGNAHLATVLRDSAGVALMYFPGTTTVEVVWKNDTMKTPIPARAGARAPACLIIDLKKVVGEITLQGYFMSSPQVDPDYVTALRALNPVAWAAPLEITPQMQWNWTFDQLISEYDLELTSEGNSYNANNMTNVQTGTYPHIVWEDARIISQNGVDRIDFVLKFSIGKTSLR